MNGTLRIRVRMTFSIKEIYTVLMALLLPISFYNIPFLEVGLSTFFLILFLPYPIVCIVKNSRFRSAAWLCLFFAYLLIRSGGQGTYIFLTLLALTHILGAFNGSLDFPLLNKTILFAITVSAALILLQSFLYYLFGVRTALLIPALLRAEDRELYFSGKEAVSSGNLFRPSGLFLEPSHFAQYCMPALIYLLFSDYPVPRKRFRWALFLSLCCLLTISSLGVLICAGVLLWYLFFTYRAKHPGFTQTFLLALTVAILLLLALCVPLIRFAFARIFTNVGGYNAVSGRLFFWDSTVGTMAPGDMIFGLSMAELPEVYMTGFMQILYCDGIVGVALFFAALISLIRQMKRRYVIGIAVGYGLLLFAGNLISFISMSFWFSLLVAAVKYDLPGGGMERVSRAEHTLPTMRQLDEATRRPF